MELDAMSIHRARCTVRSLVSSLLAGCLLLLSACKVDGSDSKVVQLTGLSVDQLSDGRFLTEISSIVPASDGVIFVGDQAARQVIVLDSLLQVRKIFGRVGEGPGEFHFLGSLVIRNDTVFVSDGRRINMFSPDGVFHRSVPIPKGIYSNFCVDKTGNIFVSDPRGERPVVSYDRYGNQRFEFGTRLVNSSFDIHNRLSSVRHLHNYKEDLIIAVGSARPVIEIYSSDGQLDSSLDLSNHSLFKSRLNYSEELHRSEPEARRIVATIQASHVWRDKLFLVVLSGPRGNVSANRVMVIDLATLALEDSIELVAAEKPLPWISAIGTDHEGSIIAFDAGRGRIYTFKP